MTINEDLISILICPDTKQPVKMADSELIETVNQKIAAGEQKNVSGKSVTEKIDGGLLRQDGKVLYPIRDEIPIMLVGEGLQID